MSTSSPRDDGYGVLTAFHALTVFVIILLNGLLFCTLLVSRRLRTASNVLFANIWLANLILGVVTAVTNVANGGQQRDDLISGRQQISSLQRPASSFSTSEWTATVVNCFVTISVLLALTANRLMTLRVSSGSSARRQNTGGMSLRTVFKLASVVWISVLLLSIAETFVSSMHEISPDSVCYACLLGFELTCLFVFSLFTLVAYCFSLYLITVRKNRSVYDTGRPRHHGCGRSAPADRLNLNKEYRLTSTVGLMLTNFAVACVTYIVFETMFAVADRHYASGGEHAARHPQQHQPLTRHPVLWDKSNGDRRRRTVDVSNGLVVGLLYAHCLLNPIVFLCRDDDACECVRRFIECWRRQPSVADDANGVADENNPPAFIRPAAIGRENSDLSSAAQL